LERKGGEGVHIQKIRSWQIWLKNTYTRIAFITQYYAKKLVYKLGRKAPQLRKVHLNAFPAVHLNHMEALDYILKFSSELLVLLLALVVGALNIYFFSGNEFNDKSLAANYLNKHSILNRKLYAKNNSIITTITPSNPLFPQAQAQDFSGLESQNQVLDYTDDTDTIINDGVIVKPNPDSIQALLDKQIKIYTTQPGDTLASIAAANGISQQTIMWANKLTAPQIKPGWQLIILPINGVLVKATSNDTLPDIAKKYNANLDKIISYNLLDSPEDIDTDQLIIVPDGVMPAPPKPKVTPKTTPSKPGTTQPKVYDVGTGHIFPWGYCTYYVATKVHVPWGGNAKNWLANAKAYGAVVSNIPAVGSIVVTTDNSRYGHVALVEKVEDDRFLVSEMNYKGKGIISTRWISNASRTVRGFIYH
jgi:peptidoglycan DL-endopeptidase CwlO